MIARCAVVLVCALLLSACTGWSGPPFYSSADATPSIRPGVYRLWVDGKREEMRWDGTLMHDIPPSSAKGKDNTRLIVAALPMARRDVFIVQVSGETLADSVFYVLLERQGDHFLVNLPDCAMTEGIVRAAGGTMDPPPPMVVGAKAKSWQHGGQSCHFSSRAGLELAARRYIKERQLTGLKIERIGD